MREPNPRTSRLAIAAGLVVALALGGAGFLVGRSTVPEPEAPAPAPQPSPTSSPTPDLVAALDMAALSALAGQAADAYASNGEMPAEVLAATGRRFDLVMPFGCDGPDSSDDPADAASSAAMRWRYDTESEMLRVAATPTTWRAAEWGIENPFSQAVALRGFWIARPWTSASVCATSPSRAAEPDSRLVLPPENTLAIARWAEDGDGSKSRSFEIDRRVPQEDFSPHRGLQLRIVGRIRSTAGSSPIRCVQPMGSEQRPRCLITASFAELRIENPGNGEVLGVWPIADGAAKVN